MNIFATIPSLLKAKIFTTTLLRCCALQHYGEGIDSGYLGTKCCNALLYSTVRDEVSDIGSF